MKILHIVGNRPQFIKLAMLQRALVQLPCESLILHTGQHFDPQMSQIFFDQLDIPKPDYVLGINGLTHNQLLGSLLIALDKIIPEIAPQLVVVYGDTNSTLAGALAAKKRNIPIAHIEAGIRTGNEEMPEESNRYLTDRMAQINFCCTYKGMENLRSEGYGREPIPSTYFNCGDLMLDACRYFKDRARNEYFPEGLGITGPFILASIHREENTEKPGRLENIIEGLNLIHKQIQVVLPLHPKTKMILEKRKIETDFIVAGAMGYLEMLALMQKCQAVITDSGGLCREAFFLQKKLIVVMEKPFWPELFDYGPCLHAEALSQDLMEKYTTLLNLEKKFDIELFGDGYAAEKISRILLSGKSVSQ